MDGFLVQVQEWYESVLVTIQAFAEAVFARLNEWWLEFGAWSVDAFETAYEWISVAAPRLLQDALVLLDSRAADHPILTLAAIGSVGLAVLVTRNVLALTAISFLAIAALVGAEPVTDPLARVVFSVGCLISIAFILGAIFSQYLKLRKARRALRLNQAEMEELQKKYQDELRWRMAERRAVSARSGNQQQTVQNPAPASSPPSAGPTIDRSAGQPGQVPSAGSEAPSRTTAPASG